MEGRAEDAIYKLTAAMSRLDENQQAFQKEDDYKAIGEAFKAAYDVLKDLKPTPTAGVTSGTDAIRNSARALEQDVRNGTRNLQDLATLLDNRSEEDDDLDDDHMYLVDRRNEAVAVVRALFNLFTAYPNGMMHRETAAANPFLVRQLVRRMNVQRMADYVVAHGAVEALVEMVHECPAAKKQFFDQEGLEWLIDMLEDNNGGNTSIIGVSSLVSALTTDDPDTRVTIGQRKDIFTAFVQALLHLDNDEQDKDEIARALFHLSKDNAANQKAIREAGAVGPLAAALAEETLAAEPENNFALALMEFAIETMAEMEGVE